MALEMLVITAADYYLGHHSAIHILETYHQKVRKLVLTASNPERLEYLRKKEGVDVEKIDPNDWKTYKEAFKGADWVIFYDEPESGRVQAANRAIDAMKEAKVKHVIMVSVDSADCEDLRYLAEFREIEGKLCSTMNDYVILRCSIFQNLFHMHAPYVADHKRLPLDLPENAEFAPVHLDDVINACMTIIKDGIEKHRGEVYTLTGPKTITGPKTAQELSKAVDKKIEYEHISHSEMEKYLKSLKLHVGEHLKGIKEEAADKCRDRLECEFMGQPTDHQVHTYIEEMKWLEKGNARKTDDLKKLTGHEGRDIHCFFHDHKAEFAPSH